MNQIYNIPKISAVCCTFGRFKCVERAMNCFLAQDYPNKELIIYNTDTDSPYDVGQSSFNITILNCQNDSITQQQYTNVGAIRRDALMFATGDYVVTWDDDDIFLPHFMSQAIKRMSETGMPSFKPKMSFFYSGNNLRLVKNTLEASVVASMDLVRKYGYLLETGKEGLAWYTKMRDNKELDENDGFCIPSYCFNWNDGQEMSAPHKQSGDIDNPNNFNNHKEASKDAVNGRTLQLYTPEQMKVYNPYFDFLKENKDLFPEELFNQVLQQMG